MDDRAIARWRLHTQRLAGAGRPSAQAVVAGLLGVQAENYPQASWAVATRTAGVTRGALQGAFDEGAVLRTHVLRATWHFVLPADIRWLLELTAPRIRPQFTQVRRALGLDDAVLDTAAQAIVDALSEGAHLTRDDLGARLRDAGLPAEGMRLGVMVAHAELSALICSGVMRGRDHTYALLAERAPDARRLDRDEALAEIALRYVRGHGPATERDLAYWATLTLTDVRAGLAAVAHGLDRFDHDGRTYWFAEPPPQRDTVEPRGHLLQTLDEYHNGYQDSRATLDADGLVARGRRSDVGMALVDGQMVGGVRRRVTERKVTFEVSLLRDLAGDELDALCDAGRRCGRFLGLPAEVVTSPR